MGQELAGKVAIVTGGANGIGRAAVELFVEEGAKVVVADLEASGEQLAKSLGSAARFKRTDVSKADDIQSLIDFTVAEFGGLHVMFNNAGMGDKGTARFLDLDMSNFDQVMRVNVLGVMLGCQRAGRHMAKHGGGSIINTSSISATLNAMGMQIYRAGKAGILQFSKAVAIDLAEHNIRVNCILPGLIRPTAMTTHSDPKLPPETRARLEEATNGVMMKYQPLKRQGSPRDIAYAALYFASDRSAQVTGTSLIVDGGFSIGDSINHMDEVKAATAAILAA